MLSIERPCVSLLACTRSRIRDKGFDGIPRMLQESLGPLGSCRHNVVLRHPLDRW